MKRKLIRIDAEKCNGCGQCVAACVEGAIELVDGKAKLVKDDYCDGLGACLGECPMDAITIEEREAPAFDEAAAKAHAQAAPAAAAPAHSGGGQLPCGCPSSAMRTLAPARSDSGSECCGDAGSGEAPASRLGQWPIQLALLPVSAPFLKDRELALVADCVGFAFPGLHRKILAGRAVAVACPKLDDVAGRGYVEKLAAILKANGTRKLTVYRMEVPCCGGLTRIAREALEQSGTKVPFEEVVIAIEGGTV